MRWHFASLPWDMLGPRLVMLSLTYPGDWLSWVPDGKVWEKHRRAFADRWRRKWGAPMGVWVKEFQKSGRPHLHIYLAVPDAVAVEDYEGLRQRTLLRHRLEADHGRFEGRRRVPPIGGKYGGEFAMWLRTTWAEIVGTQGVDQRHHARGVDVSVAFWSDEQAVKKDRIEVAKYLAGESSKWVQKTPPEGFLHVGRYWGHWGAKAGFCPSESDWTLDAAVACEVERRLVRWVRLGLIAQRRKYGESGAGAFDQRRWGDGVRAFGFRGEDVARLLRYAEAAAERKALRRQARGSGGEAPGEMTLEERYPWLRFARPDLGACDGVGWGEPDDDGRLCCCGPGEVCEECIPEEAWVAAGYGRCGCVGDEACEECIPEEAWLQGA